MPKPRRKIKLSKKLKANRARISNLGLGLAGLILLIFISGAVWLLSSSRQGRVLGVEELVKMEVPEFYTMPLRVAKGEHELTVTPLSGSGVAVERDNNQYIYKDAYPNTDVVQTELHYKIKEELIFKKPGHPSEFRYRLGGVENYVVEEDVNGNIIFYDKKLYQQSGKNDLSRVFTIPAPFIEDARKERAYNIVALIEGDELIVKINKPWLARAQYPIIVDPTIEINVLNVHSHPQQGDNWIVDFTTVGQADLKIIPDDQATIDDDEFVSLSCDGEIRQPQILDGDVIYYPDWQCDGVGRVNHKTIKAGQHTLKFDFGGQTAYAYNAGWYNASWLYRKQVIIEADLVISTETGFPVLATTTDTDLKTKARADGYDIVFTASDGVSELNYEREQWDNSSGQLVAWIQADISSTTDTTLYMYYGNSGQATDKATTTGVWDDNYKGVWHLDEDVTDEGTAASAHQDSTVNNNDGNQNGNVEAVAQIDYGQSFDGNDYVAAGDIGAVDSASQLTGCTWVYHSSLTSDNTIMAKNISTTDGILLFRDDVGNDSLRNDIYKVFIAESGGTSAASIESMTASPLTTWTYICFTAIEVSNVVTLKLYINGTEDAASPVSVGSMAGWDSGTSAFTIGARSEANFPFSGIIDEVRISNITRSATWIETEYNNQVDVASFLIFYGEESNNSAPTITSVSAAPHRTDPGDQITFSVDWNDADAEGVKMLICKSDQFTTGASPSCNDGNWCTNDNDYDSTDPLTCSYTTQAGDKGANSFWAFVCDNEPSCSAGKQGSFIVGAKTEINSSQAGRWTKGLVGLWTFDGPDIDWGSNTAYDRSGQGNNGVITSMSTSTSPVIGKVGQALDFDGVGDYASIADASIFENAVMSVSVWVKFNTLSSRPIVFKRIGATEYGQFSLGTSVDSKLYWLQSQSGTAWNTLVSSSITSGSWHHIVGTNDGSTARLYIDGVGVGTPDSSPATSLAESAEPLNIGFGRINDADSYFDGIIDEVRIYNRALSPEEIQEIYDASAASHSAKPNSPVTNYLTNGLVGYWTLDGQDTNWTSASAGTTNDKSGQGNTGTLTNMSRTSSPVIGKAGQALQFDGSNDYVQTTSNVLSTANNFTITVWFKANATNYAHHIIWQGYSGGNGWGELTTCNGPSAEDEIHISLGNWNGSSQNNKLSFFLGDTLNANNLQIAVDFSDTSNWNFAVATVSNLDTSPAATLFLNGASVGSDTGVTGNCTDRSQIDTNLRVGRPGGNSRYFNGLLDEVRIYNRALSPTEVTELYNLGVRKFQRN